MQRPAFRQDRELSDQLNRAALSVLFNISEGFLRRRDKETMQFLRYAIASNGELKAGSVRNFVCEARLTASVTAFYARETGKRPSYRIAN